MKRFFRPGIPAFTLDNMLVTLLIIGALTAMAIPILMPLISKAKSTEAQLQLEHIYTLEKNYYYMNSKYSTNYSDISYEQAKLVSEGGTANYKIEISDAGSTAFKARATAITDFDGDGTFNVWEVDQDKNIKEVTPD